MRFWAEEGRPMMLLPEIQGVVVDFRRLKTCMEARGGHDEVRYHSFDAQAQPDRLRSITFGRMWPRTFATSPRSTILHSAITFANSCSTTTSNNSIRTTYGIPHHNQR